MKLTYHLSEIRRVAAECFDAEDGGKMMCDLSRDRRKRQLASQPLLHGGDTAVKNSARDDPFEVGEIRVHVEGEPVHRHPAADLYADGRNFFTPNPYARKIPVAPRGEAISGKRPDQHFLQVPKIAMNVAVVGAQVDNGIPDDLARPVVRDVPSPVGQANLDPPPAQLDRK